MFTITVANTVAASRKNRDAAFQAAAAALNDRHAPGMEREQATITASNGETVTVQLAMSPMGRVSTGIEAVA